MRGSADRVVSQLGHGIFLAYDVRCQKHRLILLCLFLVDEKKVNGAQKEGKGEERAYMYGGVRCQRVRATVCSDRKSDSDSDLHNVSRKRPAGVRAQQAALCK